jgi:alanine racemase
MSGRPTVATVDLGALAHNYRALTDYVAHRTPAPTGGALPVPAEDRAAFLRAGEGERDPQKDSLTHTPPTPLALSRQSSPGEDKGGAVDAAEFGRGQVSPQGDGPRIIGVVKANAYGHGAARVALTLEAAGAPMLACADIEEGILLRRAGVRIPILVFGALSLGDVDGLFDFKLTPTVSTPAAVRTLAEAAARRETTLACHLKIDTGMNRLGFRHDQLDRTMPALIGSASLSVAAVYTHFATADEPESPLFNEQRERFDRVLQHLRALGLGPVIRHAANSAALLRDERVWFDYVRPGLLLYGLVPPPLATTIALKPVMTLTSRIVSVKGLRPGEGVSYGMKFRTDIARKVAVVPAGYADGLDTRLGNRGSVLVRGRRASIVGAVCMDMLMIDVTDLPVEPGDEVVILGEQSVADDGRGAARSDRMDAREMAAAVGTIPWELLCRIGTRIERVYKEA